MPRFLHRILIVPVFVFSLTIGGTCDAQSSSYAMVQMADGFDLPVGPPDGKGYYVYRGFTRGGHRGEDWNGTGMGNTDLGDPVYSCAHGIVVYSADYQRGWGNCVIVRHAFRAKDGQITYVDSLYGHFEKRLVKVGEHVKRGQQIGTIGQGPRRMYTAHLHFEIHKNLKMGMSRVGIPADYSHYYSPRHFIRDHSKLRYEPRKVRVPINTFANSNPFLLTTSKIKIPEIGGEKAKRPNVPEEIADVVKEQTSTENTSPEATGSIWDRLMGVFVRDEEDEIIEEVKPAEVVKP